MQGYAKLVRFFPDRNRWSAKMVGTDWHIFVPVENRPDTEKKGFRRGSIIKVTKLNQGTDEAISFVEASDENECYTQQIQTVQAQKRGCWGNIEKTEPYQVGPELQTRRREAIEVEERRISAQAKLEATVESDRECSKRQASAMFNWFAWAYCLVLLVFALLGPRAISDLKNEYRKANSFSANACLDFTVKSIGGCDAKGLCMVELSRWFHENEFTTVRYPAVGKTVPVCRYF